MFSMTLEWDSSSMPINHRFGLIRVYWNSWFYLLTNLLLSLFDLIIAVLPPSVLDILSTPCPRPFLRLSAVFFFFDHDFISSISDCFPISLFEFLLHTSHQQFIQSTVSTSIGLCFWPYLSSLFWVLYLEFCSSLSLDSHY